MSVQTSDIKFLLTGGAANSDPNTSLGGDTSAVEVNIASLNDLFNYVTEDEAAAGSVKYRCYVRKNTSLDIWYNVKTWQGTTLSPYTSIEIALDDGNKQTIADENTAPVGITFSAPATKSAGLSSGNLATNGELRIWVKRTVAAGALILDDSVTIYHEGGNSA